MHPNGYPRLFRVPTLRRPLPVLVAALLLGAALTPDVPAASAGTIVLHSGNGSVGNMDSQITYLQETSFACCSEFPPFTSADFLAAQTGPAATVRNPYAGWITGLACDSAARWIAENSNGDTHTTLYAYPFDVDTCCVASANLTFCWAVDDYLGGDSNNPAGVYLNGDPLTSISGGGIGTESSVGPVDVTSMIQCGRNWLYVYDRDTSSIVSGVMFSATLDITPCIVPTRSTTWSTIKTMYH